MEESLIARVKSVDMNSARAFITKGENYAFISKKKLDHYDQLQELINILKDRTNSLDNRFGQFLEKFHEWRDQYHKDSFRMTRWAEVDPMYALWKKTIKPMYKEHIKDRDSPKKTM